MKTETVLSGIRATGRLHFGNFLGAVNNFVRFQQAGHNCLYFIADMHTLTTLDNPQELRDNVLEVAKDYLAAGLDPNLSTIYTQSSVPEVAELALYLAMFQPLGELQVVPTYKDLVRKHPDRVTLGLITYPVLMAADIFGPRATLVPVGEDQVPNVELARDLARKFNRRFGETFIIPEMMKEMVKIPGLDGSKMGKSDADNAIDITAPIETIRTLYRKRGVTDPLKINRNSPGDPFKRCKSVYAVHEAVTEGERSTQILAKRCIEGSLGCAECKDLLVDRLAELIGPFQEKRRQLADQDDYVRDVLIEGGRTVKKLFQATLSDVRQKIGIVVY